MKTLRAKQVAEKVGVSEPTIWVWVRQGHFPKPFKLGPNTTVWDEGDLDKWLLTQKQETGDGNDGETEGQAVGDVHGRVGAARPAVEAA